MTTASQGHSSTNKLAAGVDRLDAGLDAVDDMKERVKERAQELADEGRQAIEDAGNSLRERVAERPFTSLAIAGGIGLLLGMLIARRR